MLLKSVGVETWRRRTEEALPPHYTLILYTVRKEGIDVSWWGRYRTFEDYVKEVKKIEVLHYEVHLPGWTFERVCLTWRSAMLNCVNVKQTGPFEVYVFLSYEAVLYIKKHNAFLKVQTHRR
jgi:hypothetical protein